jgi:hypothetical protein
MNKGKFILLLAATLALGACSSINPFNDSKMVEMDRLDAKDALRVPKYMLEAQPNNIGVGEGRADNPQTSRDLASHYARVELCSKLSVQARSRTRTTAAQNSKGARSATSVTGTVASETQCAAAIGSPDVLDVNTVQFGREYVTWTRIQSDAVEAIQSNEFSAADAAVAQTLKVD